MFWREKDEVKIGEQKLLELLKILKWAQRQRLRWAIPLKIILKLSK